MIWRWFCAFMAVMHLIIGIVAHIRGNWIAGTASLAFSLACSAHVRLEGRG